MITQARTHGVVGLWLLLIAALVFVAAGIGMLIIEPHKWLVPLASTGFFGFCAVIAACICVASENSTKESPRDHREASPCKSLGSRGLE
jgi:hypothetical protein